MRLIQTYCNIPGCVLPHTAKGFCNIHYTRARERHYTLNENSRLNRDPELLANLQIVRVRKEYVKKKPSIQTPPFQEILKEEENPTEVGFCWDETSLLI